MPLVIALPVYLIFLVLSTTPILVYKEPDFLELDKNALDQEISQHPDLLFKVAEAHVEAIAERDSLKEQLATVDATLDAKIRLELDNAGEKVTESIVKNQVQSHPLHKSAFDDYSAAKKDADVLGALRDSFNSRGHLIRDLAQLHMAQYWENTSVTGSDPVYRRQRAQLAQARERRE